MANFTINSLPDGALNTTDNLLKSNSEGVLNKISALTLKQAILNDFSPRILNVLSIDDLNSQLDTLLSGMVDGDIRLVVYAPSGRYAPFQAMNYVGTLHRVNAANAWVDFRRNADEMNGWKVNGVWNWGSVTEQVLLSIRTPTDSANPDAVTVEADEPVSGTNTRFYAHINSVHIQYQGASKTHATGKALFTLPAGRRPHGLLYVPFVKGDGTTTNAYGTLSVNTDGVVKVSMISSTTASGRIYTTFDFPIMGWVTT